MRTRVSLLMLLALAALAASPAGAVPPRAVPVVHEELARTLDQLVGQLHDLGARFVHGEPGGDRPLLSYMLRHREELGLSADQAQGLERLRTEFQREAIRRDADRRVAEMDLALLLAADSVDLGQVEVKLREIERLRVDLRLARIRTIEQGKGLLTAEQREKLRRLLAIPPGGPLR